MRWPFQSKIPTHASFSIDKYQLDAPLEEVSGLSEFSNSEYEAMRRKFEGEKNYNAPPVIFLGRPWKLILGTVLGKIYKIAIYLELGMKDEANSIAMDVLQYCVEKLGKPATQKTGLFIWDTTDGNVILQTVETVEGLAVNLFLTSSSVRNFKRM